MGSRECHSDLSRTGKSWPGASGALPPICTCPVLADCKRPWDGHKTSGRALCQQPSWAVLFLTSYLVESVPALPFLDITAHPLSLLPFPFTPTQHVVRTRRSTDG
jgi:hypothetical protein